MCVGSDGHTKCSSQSKVSEFDDTLCTDQEVLRLEVSVQHSVWVAELNALQDLECIALKENWDLMKIKIEKQEYMEQAMVKL